MLEGLLQASLIDGRSAGAQTLDLPLQETFRLPLKPPQFYIH